MEDLGGALMLLGHSGHRADATTLTRAIFRPCVGWSEATCSSTPAIAQSFSSGCGMAIFVVLTDVLTGVIVIIR